MNWLSAANIPVSTCTSFGLLGGLRRFTTSIWSRLAFIPRLVIRYPRNLPTPTPKVYFSTFRRKLCCRSTLNTPKIFYMSCFLFTLYHHIVDVYFYRTPYFIPEHPRHHPLVRGSGVLQSKWHHILVIVGIWGDECCLFLILRCQGNLMIPLKGVQKAHPRVSVRGIYQLVDLQHKERIFQACPV